MKRRSRKRSDRKLAGLVVLAFIMALAAGLSVSFTSDKPAAASEPVVLSSGAVELTPPTVEPTQNPERETVPPEPPEEITPEPARSRYDGLEVSDEDIYTLACLVYHEARGEPFEGQVAVVEVVFNRMLSGLFPDTVEEVVFQKYGRVWQFSPAPYLYTAEPGDTQYEAVYTALSETEYILTEETVFFSTEPYNEQISAIIGNHYFCEVEEAKQ